MIAGAIVGAGSEIINSLICGEDINWGRVADKAAIGALQGAIAGLGAIVSTGVRIAVSIGNGFVSQDRGRFETAEKVGELCDCYDFSAK